MKNYTSKKGVKYFIYALKNNDTNEVEYYAVDEAGYKKIQEQDFQPDEIAFAMSYAIESITEEIEKREKKNDVLNSEKMYKSNSGTGQMIKAKDIHGRTHIDDDMIIRVYDFNEVLREVFLPCS